MGHSPTFRESTASNYSESIFQSSKSQIGPAYLDSAFLVKKGDLTGIEFHGNLPDGCSQLNIKVVERSFSMSSLKPSNELCTSALVPFKTFYPIVEIDFINSLQKADSISINSQKHVLWK